MSSAGPPIPADLDLPADTFGAGSRPRLVQVRPAAQGSREIRGLATELGGGLIFEGDIAVVPIRPVPAQDEAGGIMLEGVGIAGDRYRWPGGVIHFICQAAVEPLVIAAIEHWTARTAIRFARGVGGGDYVAFEQRGNSCSAVGRIGGGQAIGLAPDCTVGVVIHEIGHAIGLWHEQSRVDRDEYVTVVRENVSAGNLYNFDKHDRDGIRLGDYDYQSIMHYPADAFSGNGRPTIVTRTGQPIGQRNGLSDGDVAAVRRLYPGLNW